MLIDIVHTNDIHSNINNFAKVAHYVDSVRKKNDCTLVFDSGDMITGEYQFNLYRGDVEAKIANLIKYDAYTLGNHEFDNGYAFLKKHMNRFDNKFIQSNILNASDYITNFEVVKYIKLGDIKVGILALTCPYLIFGLDKYPNFASEDYINDLIKSTAKKADVVIVLSHMGYNEDVKLANLNLPIDIIIGAHSHDEVVDNHLINDTLLVQTGCFLKNVGHIEFDTKTNIKTSKKISMSEYKYEDYVVKNLIDQTNDAISNSNLEVFGTTASRLVAERDQTMKHSTNFGSLVCDSYFHYAQLQNIDIDFAFINSKGIRMSIEPGLITSRELFNALPFGKTMFILKILGSGLKEAIDNNVIDLQTAKLRIDKYHDNGLIKSVLYDEDGNLLENDRFYYIMTVDYVYKSDWFSPLNQAEIVHKSIITDVEIVSSYIRLLPNNFEYLSNQLVNTIVK